MKPSDKQLVTRGTGSQSDERFPFYAQLKRALRQITTDISTHVAASDPHAQYLKEADANYVDLTDGGDTTLHVHAANGPSTADYLVGTTQAGLSAEIVVGTSPGGELGGTWGTPTIDTTHSGSSHAATQAAAEATAAAALGAPHHTVRFAAGVPAGAPTTTELPIAFDSTAITGGVYYWTGAAWVKGGTI